MDGDNNRGIAILCSIVFLIGLMVGAFLIRSEYKADTYDCTVKCLMAHSIAYNEKCYCEVK
jgi:hypothetical protein